MWDDFVSDIEQVGEALGNFFENHWKLLLTLMTAFMIGVLMGYGVARPEDPATEQAEAYVETIGGEEESMNKFIEVHEQRDPHIAHLVNINHITEVIDNKIYTDDILPEAYDYPYIECCESYEEIKNMIAKATEVYHR